MYLLILETYFAIHNHWSEYQPSILMIVKWSTYMMDGAVYILDGKKANEVTVSDNLYFFYCRTYS